MFTRKFNNKAYKIISSDGCGIELKVPRYKKTEIKIGNKQDAELRGLNPKGKDNFYTTNDGSVVIDGYLSEAADENKVEMKVRGSVSISNDSWNDIKKEIEFMLQYTDK